MQHAARLISSMLIAGAATRPLAAAFDVKRASQASAVASAPPIATVVASPFDDAAASLADGVNYFYAVFDSSGRPMTIAVQRNAVVGCLRLSFDDGNPASAPVSASRSTVTVAPASIRADGIQTAVATVVPRDANGVLLGRGLTVSVDASLLWPGHIAGAIEDLGDGTYRARIASDVPGAGLLDVSVEGVALAAAPSLTYTAPDPNGSLRDLAILQLRDMTAFGSRFAALSAQAGAGTPAEANVQQAWIDASSALDALANGNLAVDDNVLKTDLDAVLRQLAPLLDAPGSTDPADVRDLMNDILDAARLIAVYHLDLAERGCGVCSGGAPRKVCDAADALAAADAARTAISPDWSNVVDVYAWSVERSIQAEHGC